MKLESCSDCYIHTFVYWSVLYTALQSGALWKWFWAAFCVVGDLVLGFTAQSLLQMPSLIWMLCGMFQGC